MLKIGIECESIEESQTWGVARLINKLLEEIARRPELAHEFKFFLYFKSKIPNYPYLASPLFEKKLLRVPSFSLYYYVFLPVKLWFDRPNVMYYPNYMLPLMHRGRSLVVLTDDIYYEMRNPQLPWRYRLAYRVFCGWAARYATKIMTISEASRQALLKLFKIPPSRLTVNHLGVALPKFEIQNSKFKIEGDYILYVGQAFPRRHLRETILAFKQIAADFPGLKLVAIGKDKYHPPVVADLLDDNIIHKNYVSDEELVALYQGAKLSVYVSSHEAFGLPPLEALGQGTPVVVAAEPINRELYGDKAFFVSAPYTVENIAAVLRHALWDENQCQAIKTTGPELAKKYTWSSHADRWLEIIRQTAVL